jgi:protein-S-isoprenylcysteine O-methyltransferase Ste14
MTAIDPIAPELPAASPPSATPVLFRFRVVIFTALYLVGFNVPWSRYFHFGTESTTWIGASWLLERAGLMNLAYATIFVTICALAFSIAGAWLRIWATAYIGAGVMGDKSLRADHVVASGPYRYLRNPLYLGNMFTCLAVCILMPPAGALFFLAGCALLTFGLVAAEGPHLAQQLGAAYADYRARVPSFLPAMRAHVPAAQVRPQWAQSLAAESFHMGFAACLLVFAWQYNVELLIRCLLICFGVSLVANGIFSARGMRAAVAPPA